jgi:type III secretion system HrpE/YscL family protein
MSFIVLHRDLGRGASLNVKGGRLERGAFESLKSADAVLREARATAMTMIEDRERELADEHAVARDAGFNQGRTEGMVAVLGALEVERRLRELLADRISDVVEQSVRSLLGELGPTEVFKRRVRHLLQSTQAESVATLHVCPSQAYLAQAVIAEHAAVSPGALNWLTVYSDDNCPPDTVVLETRVGFVDASIELTLNRARDVIGRAVQRATASLGF